MGQKWTGFTMRFELWLNYLNKIDDNEIIMITDAYDVIILEDSEIILDKFRKFNKNIVFTVSKNLSAGIIFGRCLDNITFSPGSFIGYVKYIKQLIKIFLNNKALFKKNNNDDQILLNKICKIEKDFFIKNCKGDNNYKLFLDVNSDYNQSFYLNYYLNNDINYIEMSNKKLYYKNNTFSVLHLSGNINGNKYLNYLNYNTENINLDKSKDYKFNQIYFFLKIIIRKNIKLIKFILILILLLVSSYKNS
jgi:hypothetical protein